MLRILINGMQADLEGVKFNLQLNSPIPFNPEDNQVEGSFAFGVAFPATTTNKKIFGFADRLELYPESGHEYQGVMFFDGRPLFKVMISLTEATAYSFKGNIKVDLGYYTSLIGDKSLRDLAYEGDITIGTTAQEVVDHANDVVTRAYPDVMYNFPELYNPKFYGDEKKLNPTWQNLVNFYIHGEGFRPNVIDNDNEVQNYYNLCPFPYLFYVLKKCYSEFGYAPKGPVFDNTELASLLIYNNYALDALEERYKSIVQLSANQNIPAALTQLNFDIISVNIDDCYKLELYRYLIKESGYHHITGHLSAKVAAENSDRIMRMYVYCYVGNTENEISETEISYPYDFEIDLDYTQDIEEGDIGHYISIKVKFQLIYGIEPLFPATIHAESWWGCAIIPESTLNIYAKTINISNHVPDLKISSFLLTLMKQFGIVHIFNNRNNEVDLVFLKDILASTDEEIYTEFTARSSKLVSFRENKSYKLNFAWDSGDEFTKENFKAYDTLKYAGGFNSFDDLPAIGNEGYFAYVRNLHAIYIFQENAWIWYTDKYYDRKLGDGITAVNLECSPLMMHYDGSNPASPKTCPKISQEGGSVTTGRKDFGFHLVFYRGLLEDSQGNIYPFASSTQYGPTGLVIGNYELNLDGSGSLFDVFLKSYYDFIMNRSRPVEYSRYFSASEIQALDLIRPKRIFQHRFLLDELSIPMTNSSIGLATMKLQKI